MDEIFEQIINIINEVSVGKWAAAAEKVKDERKAKAEAAKNAAEAITSPASAASAPTIA